MVLFGWRFSWKIQVVDHAYLFYQGKSPGADVWQLAHDMAAHKPLGFAYPG